MTSLLIKNGTVVLDDKTLETDVLSESGKILKIAKKIRERTDQVIDAHGKLVLPGVVDVHAHIGDPQFARREDFKSGTEAAAAGGVTTLIDMVLSTPVDTPEAVKEKVSRGTQQTVVDFSLHAGMMNKQNIESVEALVKLGIYSFKAFMCAPYYVDRATLRDLMKNTAR